MSAASSWLRLAVALDWLAPIVIGAGRGLVGSYLTVSDSANGATLSIANTAGGVGTVTATINGATTADAPRGHTERAYPGGISRSGGTSLWCRH
jgi:hypothetical protein